MFEQFLTPIFFTKKINSIQTSNPHHFKGPMLLKILLTLFSNNDMSHHPLCCLLFFFLKKKMHATTQFQEFLFLDVGKEGAKKTHQF